MRRERYGRRTCSSAPSKSPSAWQRPQQRRPTSCARRSPISSRGEVMRWPWQPKHTFRSGLLRIIEGLENGSVVLGQRAKLAGQPAGAAPADLVRTFPIVLDQIDKLLRKMRAVEVELWLLAL